MKRFLRTLFRQQPIEEGAKDPVADALNVAFVRMKQAQQDVASLIDQVLVENEKLRGFNGPRKPSARQATPRR